MEDSKVLKLVIVLVGMVGLFWGCFARRQVDDWTEEVEAQKEEIVEPQKEPTLLEIQTSRAKELLQSMTLEEKVSQLFLVRYPEENMALRQLETSAPGGGYILFGKDFKNKTKESIQTELATLQEKSKVPLLIAVDEEGGTVVRVSAYSEFRDKPFLAPQKFDTLAELLTEAREKDTLLKNLGINMNLAPVLDITDHQNAFMYARTYGQNAEKTAEYANALITQMNQDGMISSMKHFPGYGDNVDTHTGIAVDSRQLEEFQTNDLIPFIAGIEAGGPTILVNHNIVECLDAEMPATLSQKVHDFLREDLSFSGAIVTDDLAMDAVKKYVENGEAAVQAVLAGNDLIITSSYEKHRSEVLKAIEEGRIEESLIDVAVQRVILLKIQYGLW